MSFCLCLKETQNRSSKPEKIKHRVFSGVGTQSVQNERTLKIFKPRVQAMRVPIYGSRLVIFSLLWRDFRFFYQIFLFSIPGLVLFGISPEFRS